MSWAKRKDIRRKEYFFEIARNGNSAAFIAASKKAKTQKERWHAMHALYDGALEAYRAGRHENFQTLAADPLLTEQNCWEYAANVVDPTGPTRFVQNMIYEILKKGTDISDLWPDYQKPFPPKYEPPTVEEITATITTLLAKIPEGQKQKLLDNLLMNSVGDRRGDYSFNYTQTGWIAGLLACGADARSTNTSIFEGNPGAILAWAIKHGQPPEVIAMLRDHGANFEDALVVIKKYNNADYIIKLGACQERAEGKMSAAVAEEVAIANVADVRKALKALFARVANLEAKFTQVHAGKGFGTNAPPSP